MPPSFSFEEGKSMNTNFMHNILNLLSLIFGSLVAYDWTAMGFTPAIAGFIIMAINFLKLVINAARDGLGGMVMPQPPVLTPAVIAEAKATIISAKEEGKTVNIK